MSSISSTKLSLADVSSDTVAALWCKIYSHLSEREAARSLIVCKAFLEILPALFKTIDHSSPAFSQQSFEVFTSRFTCLERLYIDMEYDEGLDMLDWTKVSLPNLQNLSLSCCPIKSIEFNQSNTPSLQSLSISNQGPEDAAEIKLNLPHLTSLDFEHTHLWGIGDAQQRLYLPECVSLNLYRSDDLDWIEVHAPKLMSLNLQACYSCEHVRLFPKEGGPVSVNFVNANIGTKSLKHLAKHPRVGLENMHGSNDDDDDIGDMLGYPPPNLAGMMGGPMAELFGNIMGGPAGGGGHPDDSDEEGSESDGGAAPDLNDAFMMQMFAMLQQAGYGGMPGHGAYPYDVEEADEEEEDEEGEGEEGEEDEADEDGEGDEEEEDEEGSEENQNEQHLDEDDGVAEISDSQHGSGWETASDPDETVD